MRICRDIGAAREKRRRELTKEAILTVFISHRWFRNIVPIGALFSASLIFSNLAYLTLSVSFIQMYAAPIPLDHFRVLLSSSLPPGSRPSLPSQVRNSFHVLPKLSTQWKHTPNVNSLPVVQFLQCQSLWDSTNSTRER